MEKFTSAVSSIWESYTTVGTHYIQKVVFALSDYEMSEFEALVILLGASAGFLIWLVLFFKRPKKISYLMEGGHRYYRP